jgi:xylem cysteine proteinase
MLMLRICWLLLAAHAMDTEDHMINDLYG